MTAPEVVLLLLAPAIGSFLGVLADRLPRGEDVLVQRSACRSCGARLGGRDLIPVLSFALSRGCCRHCGAALPAWLLYVEILATGAAVLALAAGGAWGTVLLGCLFLWLLIALAAADLLWFRLPDSLTAVLLAAALAMAWPEGLAAACLGAGMGAGSFWLIRAGYWHLRGREGLGLGDVKLMAGLGAFAGPYDLPLLVLLAAAGGLAAALPRALLRPQSAELPLGQQALPFGAALCAAAALLWLLRTAALLPG